MVPGCEEPFLSLHAIHIHMLAPRMPGEVDLNHDNLAFCLMRVTCKAEWQLSFLIQIKT